eukprot:m.60535 g.60535  ORF g.60535 m.60535 type:complete len:420 (+) comp7949_c0_seq1:83-1342(+)
MYSCFVGTVTRAANVVGCFLKQCVWLLICRRVKMEGNKDASDECIARARKYLKEGNFDGAEKYARKSEKLFPNSTAKGLLSVVSKRRKEGANSASNSGSTSFPASTEGLRKRHSEKKETANNNTSQSSAGPKREYTPAQQDKVTKVLRATTLYERLSVSKDADEITIKKAYKKLALHLHPDKNSAPKAEDAFRSVNKAYQILSDVSSRRHYDMTGEEPGQQPRLGPRNFQGFGDDLFAQFTAQHFQNGNGFFFHEFGGPRRPRQQAGRHARENNQERNGGGGFSFMPLIALIFIFSVVTSLLSEPDQNFSLSRTREFGVRRSTHTNPTVDYFVDNAFASTYDSSNGRVSRDLQQVERRVVQAKLRHLDNLCQMEMQKQRNAIVRGRYNGVSREDVIRKEPTPSCETLRNLQRATFVRKM